MDLQKVEHGGMDWIDLAQDSDRWCLCGNEPLVFINCREILD